MRSPWITGMVAVCAGVAGLPAWAQGEAVAADAALEMPEVVVTANRYETPAGSVGSSVTVVTGREIEARHATSVAEALRAVPGVEVTVSGGPGRLSDIFLRGAGSAQTLVLVDGVRVNSATLGAYDFGSLTAENIDRIEVLRGPQSTLYGSEAIGGVIHIITKRGAGAPGGSVFVEGGDPEQWRGGGEVHGARGPADYSVSASFEKVDGISAADESVGASEDDPYDNVSTAGRVGLDFLDDGRADATYRYYRSDIDLDGFEGLAPADDLNATSEREGVSGGLSVSKPLTAWWTQSVLVGMYDEEVRGDDPDTVFNNYVINNRNTDVTVQSDVKPLETHVVSAGYEHEVRDGDSVGAFDESATIQSVFGQDQWTPVEDLNLTAGVRADEHSEFGTETTYRGTVSYRVLETGARLHGSTGTGFKAPTLSDLFFPGYGNPALDPETSVGYDGGVELTSACGAVLDVTYFRNEFDDLISFDSTTFLAANIAEATVEGVETMGKVPVCTNLQVGATYTYMDSEDEATGRPLARRPTNRASLQVWFQPVARLSGVVSLVSVSDRIDSDGTNMDDYERVDLAMEYAATRHLTPYVRLENLLDEDYEEVSGFTTPGFSGVGGLRATW